MTSVVPDTTSATLVAEVVGATKQYPGVLALDNVSFSIEAGEVRALLGKNGAGKSTLIRLLSGVERCDTGTVRISGHALGSGLKAAEALGVVTVYQELTLIPDMTVAENMFMGSWLRSRWRVIDDSEMRKRTRVALEELGLNIDPKALVGRLPIAEQQMVEVARALREQPRLLILDEPTSSLAATEAGVVLDAVRRVSAAGVAVVYVSHRMDEIRRIAHSVTIMRDGRAVDTSPVADRSTEEIVDLMLGDTAIEEKAPSAPSGSHLTAKVVLSVEDLQKLPKVENVSFDLHHGEILGIVGVMGSGRTEILRCLAGVDTPEQGRLQIDGSPCPWGDPRRMLRRGVGLAPEERKRDGIVPLLAVDENIVMSKWDPVKRYHMLSHQRIRAVGVALMRRLSIKAGTTNTLVGTLSGGNQQKVVVGRWLHAEVDILLLDEPTRGIDVAAKAQIYELIHQLAADGMSIVVVSSEPEELVSLCERILVLRNGAISRTFSGEELTLSAVLSESLADSPLEAA